MCEALSRLLFLGMLGFRTQRERRSSLALGGCTAWAVPGARDDGAQLESRRMTQAVLRQGVLGAFRLLNRGTTHECPCCESTFARFVRRGPELLCPRCRSIARNRVLVLYLAKHPETLPAGARVLHLAPEPA